MIPMEIKKNCVTMIMSELILDLNLLLQPYFTAFNYLLVNMLLCSNFLMIGGDYW